MFNGLMMDDYQLTIPALLERAGTFFPGNDIVTRLPDGSIHRYTYADLYKRSHQLSNALRTLGVKEGDRVATLAWNTYRHLEAYFAIPTMGAVLHTLNLRLHPSDLTYIANHAEDSIIITDRSLLPLLQSTGMEVRYVEARDGHNGRSVRAVRRRRGIRRRRTMCPNAASYFMSTTCKRALRGCPAVTPLTP